MRITWDPRKNELNIAKHKIAFEFAQLVFSDPLHESYDDPYPLEQRFRTIGMIGTVCLFVVHSYEDGPDGEGHIHIISARKAVASERKAYEEGGSR